MYTSSQRQTHSAMNGGTCLNGQTCEDALDKILSAMSQNTDECLIYQNSSLGMDATHAQPIK